MSYTYQDHIDYLNQLADTLESLTALETEKQKAAAAQDLDGLNDCMKREQVMSMTLRGMEQKRQALRKELNLEDKVAGKLPADCPPELRRAASAAADRVRRCRQMWEAASSSARTMLESRLHAVDRELERRGIREDETPAPIPRTGHTDLKV